MRKNNQLQYDCLHELSIDYDSARMGWLVTHGEGGEARLFITDYELEIALDRNEGYRLVCDWLERVHAYEAQDERGGRHE